MRAKRGDGVVRVWVVKERERDECASQGLEKASGEECHFTETLSVFVCRIEKSAKKVSECGWRFAPRPKHERRRSASAIYKACVCVPNDADESKQTGGRGAASQRSEEEIVCALRNESRGLREWRESTVW